MSKKTKKKYQFTLSDINIQSVNNMYNIQNFDPEEKTTKITELNMKKGTPKLISFLDETKHMHTCNICMIDFKSRMDINLLRYNCFWCRYPFKTQPIGCPIKYISSEIQKKYYSHITKDIYSIKESITQNYRKNFKSSDKMKMKMGEYYETDGVFCSFNCCQAWILDNKHNRMYDLSQILLVKIYNTFLGTKNITINPAPHWRLLDSYGGFLSIEKYRKDFNKVDYENQGNILPNFSPVYTLYEEKIKF